MEVDGFGSQSNQSTENKIQMPLKYMKRSSLVLIMRNVFDNYTEVPFFTN